LLDGRLTCDKSKIENVGGEGFEPPTYWV
jgi:hypothetical protein